MYSIEQIIRGLKDPHRGAIELYNLYYRKVLANPGMRIMSEDWDTLVILDACRFDMFEEVVDIPGELKKKVSKGSHTSEFLQKNFSEGNFNDTIYVSATPQIVAHNVVGNFFFEKKVWENGWDDEINTVPPKEVTDSALELFNKYPNKRYIIHYLQPHYPFIGQTGRQMEHATVSIEGTFKPNRVDGESIWDQLQSGRVERDAVETSYRENLELALSEVKRLISGLDGKTVISSDHGNSYGRFGIYGHPARTYFPELVEVPWFVPEFVGRRRIKSDESRQSDSVSRDIEEKLQYLGYK